ncbi:Cu2+-exporting ATPase [Wickerhamomyces ciferrii]|uniref:P-type Cu(+) transporter n=1 Tax=Wickerhamomyces ciferrii (strain ATCC 14091 / BCRC 22168 / CBS 111 / JCM 3599 / NBRC 0793 / NRRL Y-1031 F-60-10) TaxID=1206466 RepID=K0KT26_WICCF|nr:Cu2+-exporting ATPase [Wickerhamomyces ciferrii]CCH46291.1 Cu2+-exporting ATPase [Wickerhamomyces ciferrii]
MVLTVLTVSGMTCGACSSAITSTLEKIEGVQEASVSLITEEASVKHEKAITPEAIKDAIEDCGFDAIVISTEDDVSDGQVLQQEKIYETKLSVQGMTCGACTSAITSIIEPKAGVLKFDISLVTEEAVVKHNDSITPEQLKEAIDDAGFDAEILETIELTKSLSKPTDLVETIVSIKGMTCGACTSSITNVLNDIEGVVSADVSLVTEEAKIKHFQSINPQLFKETIDDCGFDAEIIETITEENQSPLFETTKFDLDTNVDLIDIEEQLSGVKGYISSNMINSTTISITYDSTKTGVRYLVRDFHNLGIQAEPQNVLDTTSQISSLSKVKEIQFWKSSFIKSFLIGVPMFIVNNVFPETDVDISSHLLHGIYMETMIEWGLASYIQFGVGKFFYINAYNSFKHGSGTMDTLICVSTSISYFFSVLTILISIVKNDQSHTPKTLFETGVLLICFVSLGKWLENKAKSETSSSLSKLINLTSTDCTIVASPEKFDANQNNTLMKIPINYLQVNDIVEVKAGEKIPADGFILSGESEVDESLLTGESLPIHKKESDRVIGGSINGVGTLFVKITTTSENSQFSKIIKLVKSAQMNRAPIQSFADYIAGIFVPTIISLAIFTFICWTIICYALPNPPAIFNNVNGKVYICLKIAISVIVVACPCALGLAAPTAIMVGTGVGASNGVLIKGGDVLESANNVDVLLFDKTGTLTIGSMVVQNSQTIGDWSEDTVLDIVGSVESKSEHPIGVAITKYSLERLGQFKSFIESSEVKIGKGIEARVDLNGQKFDVVIGNLKVFSDDFVKENNDRIKFDSECTISHVSINGQYAGYLELQDEVKKDSVNVINYLKSNGYQVAMVSGDSKKAANNIAAQVGISPNNVYAEFSPYEKEQLVVDFQSRGLNVAFIGDGINDSPALAQSNLGIAIASGTDIALEAADIVLLNNELKLSGITSAISISIATLKRIKWNLFWSCVYNLTMLPVAMGVLIPWGIHMNPLVAGLAMAFSSVSVVVSSLLLKTWTPPDISKFTSYDEGYDYDLELGGPSTKNTKWNLKDSVKRMINKDKKQDITADDIELREGLLH